MESSSDLFCFLLHFLLCICNEGLHFIDSILYYPQICQGGGISTSGNHFVKQRVQYLCQKQYTGVAGIAIDKMFEAQQMHVLIPYYVKITIL